MQHEVRCRKQSELCAFYSPFQAILSDIEIFQQFLRRLTVLGSDGMLCFMTSPIIVVGLFIGLGVGILLRRLVTDHFRLITDLFEDLISLPPIELVCDPRHDYRRNENDAIEDISLCV